MMRTWLSMAAVAGSLAALGAVVLTPAGVAMGQDSAPAVKLGEGRGQVILTWDEFVKITGYDPAKKGQQVVTIPWKEVESLLGVELKGKVPMDKTLVDLPWNDFKALLEWSVRKKQIDEAPPPTDFIVTSSQYEGKLSADAADFTLKLKIEVLRKNGWKRVPVLPVSVALTRSALGKGVYLNASGNAYELLTEESGTIDATLEFTVPVAKTAGIQMVSFERLAPGSSTLDLKVEGEKADVKVPGAPWVKTEADNSTHAALPPGQPVQITWERALPKLAAAPTKIYAETRTLAAVADGVLVCQEDMDFSVLHTAVRELKMTAPKGVSVLDVTGRSVQDWRAEKDGNILLTLRGEAIGTVQVRVTYEQPSGETVEVPVVRAVGVERERGFVGVIALVNVEVGAGKVEGASAIDVKQLPADIGAMTKQPILLAFRYAADKFEIPLAIKKHGEISALATIADSAVFTSMQLNDGRRMTRVLYTVRNNRNQFLRIQMPMGAEIWSAAVGGETVNPGVDDQKNVLIPLVRSAASAQELASFPVEIVYVETPDKSAPTAGKLHVELPRLDAPAMHVMVNYYLPAEGKYESAGSLFTAARSGFSGPLRVVNDFAAMMTDRATAAVASAQPQQQAQAMQKQFEAKMETEAKAAGATPIRVRLPVDGKLYKLEKILALPNDVLFLDVEYSGWQVAK